MSYAQLSKALYGMLRVVLLFYKRLRSNLEGWVLRLTRMTLVLQTRWLMVGT